MKRVLLLSPSEQHFGIQMIQGIAAHMQMHDDWQLVVPGERGWPGEVRLEDWEGDGVILPIVSTQSLEILKAKRLPFVNVTAYPVSPTVHNDNVAMGRMAAEHFLNQGFRHFAWFHTSNRSYFSSERRQGFFEALAERDFHPHEFTEDYTMAKAREFLQGLPLPCAVQLYMDMHAPGIYQAAKELGLNIPEQLAVMGMDDDILGLTLSPPLSSVQPDGHRVGFKAARLLRDRFLGKAVPEQPLLIPPRGIAQRKSGSSFGFEDPQVAEALAYIRSHARQGMLVEQVVGEVGVSRRNLERRFHHVVGHSLWREMRRVQIEHVKNLLRGTNLPVKAVAAESAFPQPSRLSQVFREETGETPAEYRARHRH
jgi:LacI family transcriptional regulator